MTGKTKATIMGKSIIWETVIKKYNHMKTFLLFLISSIMLASCATDSTKTSWTEASDSIVVTFKPGLWESSAATPCNIVFDKIEKTDVDTVIKLPTDEFKKIKTALTTAKKKGGENVCDAILQVKTDTFRTCICSFNRAYNIDNEEIYINEEVIYLLKSRSGYYNYIEKDMLRYDRGIKKFGIPKDYKFTYNKYEDDKIMWMKLGSIKVIFIENSEDNNRIKFKRTKLPDIIVIEK